MSVENSFTPLEAYTKNSQKQKLIGEGQFQSHPNPELAQAGVEVLSLSMDQVPAEFKPYIPEGHLISSFGAVRASGIPQHEHSGDGEIYFILDPEDAVTVRRITPAGKARIIMPASRKWPRAAA